MEYRKLVRRLGGKYRKSSVWRSLWMVMFVALFFGCGVLSYNYSQAYSLQLSFDLANVTSLSRVSFMAVTVLTLVVVYRAMDMLRLCLYWILAAVVLMLFVTGRPLFALSLFGTNCPSDAVADFLLCPRETPCRTSAKGPDGRTMCVPDDTYGIRLAIMICLFVVECLTLLGYFLVHRVVPRLVKTGFVNPHSWWQLRGASDGQGTVFEFRTRPLCGRRATCRYKG
eukprot:RCo042143